MSVGRTRSTNQMLKSGAQQHDRVMSTVGTQILQEHRRKTRKQQRAEANPDVMLLDFDLSAEVGAMTPPVTIYRPTKSGGLEKVETLTAAEFRERARQSVGGLRWQKKVENLRAKRRKAGQRHRAASIRMRKYGTGKWSMKKVPIRPCETE